MRQGVRNILQPGGFRSFDPEGKVKWAIVAAVRPTVVSVTFIACRTNQIESTSRLFKTFVAFFTIQLFHFSIVTLS
jgi:hypothetical protein